MLLRLVLVLTCCWLYLQLPQKLIEQAPYAYLSATYEFDAAPADPIATIQATATRNPAIRNIHCVQELESSETRNWSQAFRIDCTAVHTRNAGLSSFDLFPPGEGWSASRSATNVQAGAAFWTAPISVPLAQWILQLLFAVLLAWSALKGESARFSSAVPRHLPWLLAPALVSILHVAALMGLGGLAAPAGQCSTEHYGGAIYLLMPLVVAPLGEELIYRGWAFRTLSAAGFSARGCVMLTGLIFAASHIDNFGHAAGIWGLSTMVAHLAVGIILGVIRLRTGSILMCVLAHVVANLFVVSVKMCW